MSGTCRSCGCTDDDCRRCAERTGGSCWWVAPDLCSACTLPAIRTRLVAIYEKPSDVEAWLAAPHPQLDGLSAAQAIAQGRAGEVHDIIDRLEGGVFV